MWRAPGGCWRRLVVLEYEQHGSALGGDAIVGDHQRGGQHVAVVSAEAELAVVLVAENAGDLQGLVHDLRRALRGVDLQIVHLQPPADRQQLLYAAWPRVELVEFVGERQPVVAHRLQLLRHLRESRRRRWHRAGILARARAHELGRAGHRIGGDPPPERGPQDVGVGHHGLRRGGGDRSWNDLLLGPRGFELESGTAGTAHAHRVPGRRLREFVVALANQDQHLVAARSVRRPATGHENPVGVLAVGPRSSVLVEPEASVLALDGADAGAGLAEGAVLRGHRGEYVLIAHQFLQITAEKRRLQPMPGNAGDLDVVHGQYHRT